MKHSFLKFLFIPVLFCSSQVFSQVEKKQYVDNGKCKLCHNIEHNGQQYTVWRSKAHSRAFDTLFEKKAQKFADERNLTIPPYEAAECLKCHVTGYDVELKAAPKGIKMDDGVQCGSCHGPGSAHMEDGKTLRMNKDAEVVLSKNIYIPTRETCVTCHNEESPPWNPEEYTLESGEKTGFDYKQAVAKIAHPNPNRVKEIEAAIEQAGSLSAEE